MDGADEPGLFARWFGSASPSKTPRSKTPPPSLSTKQVPFWLRAKEPSPSSIEQTKGSSLTPRGSYSATSHGAGILSPRPTTTSSPGLSYTSFSGSSSADRSTPRASSSSSGQESSSMSSGPLFPKVISHDLSADEFTASQKASRLCKFKDMLDEPVLDVAQLSKMSWSGIPPEVRPTVWKILLGYLPANKARRGETLLRKRKEYGEAIRQYYDVSEWTEEERATRHQIEIDIPRTNPDIPFFQQKTLQELYERVLYIWAIKHPATGYVQGINDLITPFFVLFITPHIPPDCDVLSYDMSLVHSDVLLDVETDCYWCLTTLLDGIQDHYTFAQKGIQRMMFKLREMLHRIDLPLYTHLEEQNAHFIQFAFRWMNCMLMREIPLHLIIRMWDTYICEPEGFTNFHIAVCAAFLCFWSDRLRKLEFAELLTELQNLPTEHWGDSEVEMLLSKAYMLYSLYSPAHLTISDVI